MYEIVMLVFNVISLKGYIHRVINNFAINIYNCPCVNEIITPIKL